MSTREQRIEVFQDTMDWINDDPVLSSSIIAAKENTTVFYEDDYPAFDLSKTKETIITVSRDRSYQAAMRLHNENPEAKIAVMNFANALRAGGGVTSGSSAQEESLCRTSTLYPLLYRKTLRDSFYKHHHDLNTPKATDSLVYTEGVIICKTDEDLPKRMPNEDWVTVDVITIAAPDLRDKPNIHAPFVNGGTYMTEDELFECHVKRATHMLTCAAAKGADILVLGAFGCGAFQNDPEVVAKAYKKVLQDFPKVFTQIEFAVYCPPGESTNYDVFKRVLELGVISCSTIQKTSITDMTDSLLAEVRNDSVLQERSIAMPLAQLATLGGGVSSLIPAFNIAAQTMSMNTQGLYRLANASVGDTLKVARNGNFWGAFKTANGGSKFVQLAEADPVSATSKIVMNANPATMLMAVALFAVEKELKNIEEMQKQIISFLEIEKESEIEADVITLTEIIIKYKHNWDNERYITSNHKLICDIQRTARKSMISYQKQVAEALKARQLIVLGSKVNSILNEMQKKFKYYRLSLYTFSLSSMAEIMLSGNFKEENIRAAINDIRKNTDEYRSLFSESSVYLENLSKSSVETNFLKGIGAASNAIGKWIGNIPQIKEGKADEFFIDSGKNLEQQAQKASDGAIEAFAEVSDPNTTGILRQLEDIELIYNKTTGICFDKDNLYLVAE